MKRLLSATVAGLIATFAFGQQEIQFTQFMNNKLYYNPGVAGSSGAICINAVHRTQWAGFENAPSTQNINAEIVLAIFKRITEDDALVMGFSPKWCMPAWLIITMLPVVPPSVRPSVRQ